MGEPYRQVQIVDGNGNAVGSGSSTSPTFVAQSTPASVTAGWPTINGELGDVTGTFTNATQTTNVVTTSSFASIDGYDTITVSINGTYGTATGVFEGSDDGGTTWYTLIGSRSDGTAVETGYTGLTNVSRAWYVAVQGYDAFRVRSTAVASGTASIRLSVSSSPTVSSTIAQLAAGTASVGSVTLPVGAGSGWTYKTYTAGTGAQVKASAGVLHAITVNTSVASATITVYDNTAASGTKIATITLPATAVVGQILFDVAFTTGLFIVPSTTTDLTVSYI